MCSFPTVPKRLTDFRLDSGGPIDGRTVDSRPLPAVVVHHAAEILLHIHSLLWSGAGSLAKEKVPYGSRAEVVPPLYGLSAWSSPHPPALHISPVHVRWKLHEQQSSASMGLQFNQYHPNNGHVFGRSYDVVQKKEALGIGWKITKSLPEVQ